MQTEQSLQDAQKEKELIQNCDAVVWASELKKIADTGNSEINTLMNFFRTKNKILPTDTGYKYNILQFRSGDIQSIEAFAAIIGDPKAYVERMGKLGFNGMMFKQKSCAKKEMKELFKKSLINWGFDEKAIKPILKNMVC